MNTEKSELRLLINEGYTLTLSYSRKRKRWQIWRKKEERVTRTIKIAEPTLATLDLLSSYWIDFTEVETDDLSMDRAKWIMSNNAMSVARVAAVATLGEGCFNADYSVNRKKIEREAMWLIHALKPTQVLEIAKALTAVSNIADFISSMRLMSAARTTQKTNRIE